MIDYGLVASMIIALAIPSLVSYWWPISGREGPAQFLDVATGPAFAALFVGRLTTLALDDPGSIGSISDMLIIRSGVEFWPGVAAGTAMVMLSAQLGLAFPARRLVEFTPLAMLGYAGFEASCVFRDGCYGPESPIGLRPPGLSATMLPIGWFMAIAVAVAAVGVHRLAMRGNLGLVVVLVPTLCVSVVRAVGSIWLPHVGDSLTRQHLTSIVVASVAAIAVGVSASGKRLGLPDNYIL